MKTADETWACSIQISALKDVFEVKFVVLSSPQVSIVNVHKALQITELEKKKKKKILFLIMKEPVFHGRVWARSREVKGARGILVALKQ